MYDVIYYYENAQRSHHESVEEGTEAKEYVPQGYSACRYYKDVDYSEEYTFDNVYEDTTVYLDCDTIEYTVVYNYDEQLVTEKKIFTKEFFKEVIKNYDYNYIIMLSVAGIYVLLLYKYGIKDSFFRNLDLIKFLIF